MSLLQNNTEALNRLRGLDKTALEAVFGCWDAAPRVVGALYNADTDGMKNILLHANPAGVVAGLKIAAVLTGAADAVLVVREDLDPQQLEADAGLVDLKLTVTRAALVNKMAYKGARLLALTRFYVDPKLCQGSGACVDACPAHCIEGGPGLVAVIDNFDCTRCGKCLEVCGSGAIKRTSGRLPKLPAAPVPVKGAAVPAPDTDTAQPVRRPAKRKRVFAAVGAPEPAETAAPAAPAEQPKPVEVKIMKTIETDVVIVAGGPAGLAAAVTVGEQGLKSVLLEKSSATGGAANMGMGPLGIDTKIQRAQFNNISVDKALQMHMEYTHYRVDEDLVQTYFHKSADTID